MRTENSTKELLVIGAGGHASVVIDVVRAAGFVPVAALDPGAIDAVCNGVGVVGGDDMAERMLSKGVKSAVIAIGDNVLRMKLGKHLVDLGFSLPCLFHPSAIISPSARLEAGTIVMPLVVLNASASIGKLAIINSGAVVEHNCVIGDGAHVAPGCRLGGTVSIGNGSLIGIGSVVRPNTMIGEFAVIGAGSTVIRDIADHVIAIGSPARVRGSS